MSLIDDVRAIYRDPLSVLADGPDGRVSGHLAQYDEQRDGVVQWPGTRLDHRNVFELPTVDVRTIARSVTLTIPDPNGEDDVVFRVHDLRASGDGRMTKLFLVPVR